MNSEVEAAKRAVMEYVEGVVKFHFERGENAWHQNGVKISYDAKNKSLKLNTIRETRPNWNPDQIEQMKKQISQRAKIISADVTGDAASIKLVWDFRFNDERKEITDYILLLKIDGAWSIVGKVFNEKVLE